MTAVQVQAPLVEFPNEEWVAVRTKEGALVSLHPVQGTWTLIAGEDRRRFAEKGMNIKAMFACPRCSKIGVIGEDFNPPKEMGDTKPLPECRCTQCGFACRVIFKNWDKRRLYCAAYETQEGDTIRAHKEYLHAENDLEAKKFFWASHKVSEVSHLVGIAPVVGFFLQNEKTDRVLIV